MKGPRSRHRHNVLRIWECPACKKRAFAPARVTTRACVCQGVEKPTWMCLIELRPPWAKPIAPKPETSSPEAPREREAASGDQV